MNMRTSTMVIALVLATAGFAPLAQAEAAKQSSPEQQALKKAQGVIRQLTQDKAALEAEKLASQEQLTKLEAQLRETLSDRDKLKAQGEALQSSKSALEGQVAADAQRLQNLSAQQQDTAALLKKTQADNQLLVRAVQERSEWIAACKAKNEHLHKTSQALLEKYQNKGLWQELAEPLTGIGEVQTENDEQEFRFKLEDLQISPFKEQKGAALSPPDPGAAEAAPPGDSGAAPRAVN